MDAACDMKIPVGYWVQQVKANGETGSSSQCDGLATGWSLARRRTPDRVRFATGRGFGRLIASHMTVFSGGAAVSPTRCRRERLGFADLRAERRLRRSAGSA